MIRALYGLEALEKCRKLNRYESLAVLYSLKTFQYDKLECCAELWEKPPGMSRDDWIAKYGKKVRIRSGKGDLSAEQLSQRVAHFLGLTCNDDAASVLKTARLTDADLEARKKQIEAELELRQKAQAEHRD